MGVKADKLMNQNSGSFSDKIRLFILGALEDIQSSVAPSGGLATENTLIEVRDKVDDGFGGNGTEYLFSSAGVGVTGKAYKYVVINEDAVISHLEDDAAVDLLVDLTIGVGTVTKGMIIRAKNGKLIEEMTLTSGSAVGVL